jgi:hypothetical protein
MIHDIVNSLIKLMTHFRSKNKRKGGKDVHNLESHQLGGHITELMACIIILMLLIKFAMVLFAGTK